MSKPRAKLHLTALQVIPRGDSFKVVACGFCTEHKGRKDLVNELVTTSCVLKLDMEKKEIETLNTIYELVD